MISSFVKQGKGKVEQVCEFSHIDPSMDPSIDARFVSNTNPSSNSTHPESRDPGGLAFTTGTPQGDIHVHSMPVQSSPVQSSPSQQHSGSHETSNTHTHTHHFWKDVTHICRAKRVRNRHGVVVFIRARVVHVHGAVLCR
jgi:hypothetical protein